MKSKNVIIITIVCLVALAIAVLCGCSRVVVIEGIQMKDAETVEIAIGEFSYEGKKIVVHYKGGDTREVDLTEDMIPEAERLKFYKVGEQEITVIYNNRHKTTFKVNVCRHMFEDVFELVGGTVTYDGSPHRVTLNHDLPEGAKLEFEYGNTFTNAGTYNVEGVISKEGYVSKKLTATLVIEQAEYDLSEMKLDNGTFVYDGEAKLLAATGVPAGVSVTYDLYDGNIRVNSAVSAGTYKVVAHFASNDKNYRKIPDKEVNLTIEKADYDMSGVHLEDYTKTFDGRPYVPALASESVLPQGVSVRYSLYQNGERCLLAINAGEYDVVASFVGNTQNYNPIEDMSAHVIVERLPIVIGDSVKMDDMTVNYDGNVHSLTLDGQLPPGVTVSFENNDQTYAGEYEVVARFSAANANRSVDVEEIRAYLIINSVQGNLTVDGHNVSAADLMYYKDTYTMTVVGLDTDVYSVTSIAFYVDDGDERRINWGDEDDALVSGTTYRYTIECSYRDENLARSVPLSTISGTYTYREILFENKAETYNGTAKTIEVENLPQGSYAKYEINSGDITVDQAINAGSYLVKATILQNVTERVLYELSATLTINKYRYDMSDVTFEGMTCTYDGTQKVVSTQNVPVGLEVRYEYKLNNETVATEGVENAGEYQVVAHFVVDETNYFKIDDMQVALTINKATVNATLLDKKWKDDGEPYYPGLEDGYFIPYGVSYEIVTTKGGVQVDYCEGPGVYTVEAHFTIDEDNVNPQEDLFATIRIYNIVLDGVVKFEDKEDYFDTMNERINAKNVPSSVNVTYEYFKGDEFISNDCVKYAGEYTVIAHFTPKNSGNTLDIDEMRATLTITHLTYDIKRQVLKRDVEPTDFWYNPETKSINFKLPSTFFVVKRIYINDSNDWHEIMFGPMSEGFSNDNGQAYHYIVEFDYITDDPDFRASADVGLKSGYFTYAQITKGNLKKISNFIYMKDQTVTYDGEIHTNEYVEVPNRVWDRDGVTVTYEYLDSNKQVVSTTGVSAVGTYTVVAHIVATDPTATLEVDEMRARLTITEG